MRETENLGTLRLFLAAVNLQVAHDQALSAAVLKENKRIRGKEGGGVKHIGVRFAGGNNQRGLPSFKRDAKRPGLIAGFYVCRRHVRGFSRKVLVKETYPSNWAI